MKKNIQNWTLPIILAFFCVVIGFYGESGRQIFQYLGPKNQPSSLSYRWFTGHFTHIGWRHLLLNLLGLIGVWAVYHNSFSKRLWIVLILASPISISLCLTFFSPHISYYVGLSGVLHGLLAAGVTANLLKVDRKKSKPISMRIDYVEVIVFAGLWFKIIFEQFIGNIPFTSEISGGNVVVEAHLYGTIIGTLLGGLILKTKH